MNPIAERDHKLTEALKPLSRDPSNHRSGAPKRLARPLIVAGGFVTLIIALVLSVAHFWPGVLAAAKNTAEEGAALVENPANVPSDPAGGKTGESAGGAEPTVAAREISGSGYVVAPQVTAVYSKYEGRIVGVTVDVGDRVETGQLLVTLDDADIRFALEQARAARRTADLAYAATEIDLKQARTSLARVETLAAIRAVARQQLDDARTAFERAANAVTQARQKIVEAALEVRIASERADALRIRAPFAGTVTRLGAHVGDSVLARADSVRENQSLLTITDTGNLVIDADVAETNVGLLHPGLRGEAVLDGFPDQAFGIEIARIAPVASAEKGTIALRLSISAPPAGIRPNMAARIRLQTGLQTRNHPRNQPGM